MSKDLSQRLPLLAMLVRWIAATPLYPPLAVVCRQRTRVTGASMYPLLSPGDCVLFDRLAYLAGQPRRGDIGLFDTPAPGVGRMVKIVAGLPGQHVAAARDRLWLDGKLLSFHQPVVGSTPGRWQLGPSEYFLLSYAVAVGTDSRHFGPVQRKALRGRALRVYWPPARRRPLPPLNLEVLPEPVVDVGP